MTSKLFILLYHAVAQCQAFATLLDRWLSARRVDALWASVVVGL
jgi:hypothetical protein